MARRTVAYIKEGSRKLYQCADCGAAFGGQQGAGFLLEDRHAHRRVGLCIVCAHAVADPYFQQQCAFAVQWAKTQE